MTREEAIEILQNHHMWTGEPKELVDVRKANKALNMAISALEQKPCNVYEERGLKADTVIIDEEARKPCEDAVSRDAVIGAICDYVTFEEYEDKSHTFTIRPLTKRIKQLPSITRQMGEWIEHEEFYGDVYYECSVCHEPWTTIEGTPWDNGMNFCPNCGADMRGEG